MVYELVLVIDTAPERLNARYNMSLFIDGNKQATNTTKDSADNKYEEK